MGHKKNWVMSCFENKTSCTEFSLSLSLNFDIKSFYDSVFIFDSRENCQCFMASEECTCDLCTFT